MSVSLTCTTSTSLLSFTASNVIGLTVSPGLESRSIELRGTKAQLNEALKFVSYQSGEGVTGSETITVVVSDLGNVGNGGQLTATTTVTVSLLLFNIRPRILPIDPATEGSVGDDNANVPLLSAVDKDVRMFASDAVSGEICSNF